MPGRFLYSNTATMNFSLMEDVYLILLLASIPASEAILIPFVNLTTEGGISLIGSHCPGTMRLFCEGTDLTSLRWTFNGDTEIDTFLPIDVEIARPLHEHRPFIFVALIEVVQNPNKSVYGNFSSVLTVDLSQLEQNVTNISCGDPGTIDAEPVNVTTILQSVPANPNITEVSATYNSAGLESIKVAWNKVPTDCPEYGLSLIYIANLTGSDPVKVNETSCGASFCSATFEGLSSDNVEYELTLSVMNDVGSSDLVHYPTMIGSQSGQYITPVLNSSNCVTSGQCISSGTLPNGTMCSVQYTTDAQHRGLSEAITTPLNTAFQLPPLDSDTTFYFIFTVPVTSTFLVNEPVKFTTGTSYVAVKDPRLPTAGNAMIAFAVLFVVLSLLLMIVILALICGGVKDKHVSRMWFKIASTIFLTICLLVWVLSIALLVTTGIVIGIQKNTCNLEWQTLRNGLLTSSLVISLLGFIAMVVLLLFVAVDVCLQKQTNQRRIVSDLKSATIPGTETNLPQGSKRVPPTIVEPLEMKRMEENSSKQSNQDKVAKEQVDTCTHSRVKSTKLGVTRTARVTTGSKSNNNDVNNSINKPYSRKSDSNNSNQGKVTSKSRSAAEVSKVSKNKNKKNSGTRDTDHNENEYDTLREANTHQQSISGTVTAENYSSIDQSSIEPVGAGNYEVLRSSEKSKPVPNMRDTNYSKLGQKKLKSSKKPLRRTARLRGKKAVPEEVLDMVNQHRGI